MDAGPFDLKQLIIGACIIIATSVAMVVLKGFLSFGFVFPIWMFVIALITVVVVIAILVLTIIRYCRWGYEGFIFAKGRLLGLDVGIDTELGSSRSEFFLCEKDTPKDIVLKDTESGTKIDPAMLDSFCKPMEFPMGLRVHIFTYYNYMAQSVQNHAAFKAIEKFFKEDPACDELRFLSIKEFCELMSDPEHYLEHNAGVKLNKYFKQAQDRNPDGTPAFIPGENGVMVPKMIFVRQFETQDKAEDGTPIGAPKWVEQAINLPELMQKLAEARRKIYSLPIPGGLIAGNEAFKNNSVAYSSQHLAHVLMLYYSKIMEDLKGQVELLTYGIVALLILVGGGLGVYIAGMGFKAAGLT